MKDLASQNATVKFTWSALWLALGIILSTATQLRLKEFPIGPGETMLVIWILIVGISFLFILRSNTYQVYLSSVTNMFLKFWFISFYLLIPGFIFSVMTGRSSPDPWRDALAFGLIAIFCFLVTTRTDMIDYMPLVAKFVLLGSVLPLFFMVLIVQLGYASNLGDIEMSPGIRFIGWAKNPNQIGALMSMAPFWAIYWLMETRYFLEKILYLFVMISSIMVGFASLSDSFIVSTLAGFFVFIGGHIILFLSMFQFEKSKKIIRLLLVGFSLVISFGLIIWYRSDFFLDIKIWALQIYNNGGQGADRLLLWQHGMHAIAISPLFGLGPGSHSGHFAPFQGEEVHNTFIDWATSTGLFGVVLYIGLLGRLSWQAWKNKNISLLAAIIASSFFSLFNYIIRHPFFWCYLLAISTINFKDEQFSQSKRLT